MGILNFRSLARAFSGKSPSSPRSQRNLSRAIRAVIETLEGRKYLDDGPFFVGQWLNANPTIYTQGNEGWTYTTDYGDGSPTEDGTGWDGTSDPYMDHADLSLSHFYTQPATLTVTDHWTADWYPGQTFDDVAYSANILDSQPTATMSSEIDLSNNTISVQMLDQYDPTGADLHYSYSITGVPGLATSYEDATDSAETTFPYTPGMVVLGSIWDPSEEKSDYSTLNIRPSINFPDGGTDPTKVTIAWADVDGNQAAWRLERSTDGTNYTLLTNVSSEITNYIDTDVTPGQTYWYMLRGVGSDGGDTAYSFKKMVTVPDLPAPTNVTTTVNPDYTINVNWELPDGADASLYQGFKIDVYDPDETITADSVPLTSYIAQGSARSQAFTDLARTGRYQFIVTGLTHATFDASGAATSSSGTGDGTSPVPSDPEASGWHWATVDDGSTTLQAGVTEDDIDSEDLPDGWQGIELSNLPRHSEIFVQADQALLTSDGSDPPLPDLQSTNLIMQLDGKNLTYDGIVTDQWDTTAHYLQASTEQGSHSYFQHSGSTATLIWQTTVPGPWEIDWTSFQIRILVPPGPSLPAGDPEPNSPPPPPPPIPPTTNPTTTQASGLSFKVVGSDSTHLSIAWTNIPQQTGYIVQHVRYQAWVYSNNETSDENKFAERHLIGMGDDSNYNTNTVDYLELWEVSNGQATPLVTLVAGDSEPGNDQFSVSAWTNYIPYGAHGETLVQGWAKFLPADPGIAANPDAILVNGDAGGLPAVFLTQQNPLNWSDDGTVQHWFDYKWWRGPSQGDQVIVGTNPSNNH